MKEIILFLGNPGTGKSTLANCHAGKVLFRAGMSFGSGLTVELNESESKGITYMDTPGLADEKLEKAAAAAITAALQKTGSYRIFFMVRLTEGRVIQEDISTIQRVMASIHLGVGKSLPFSIIVNKVEEEDYDEIVEGQPGYNANSRALVLAAINAGKFTTTDIFFLKKIKTLARKSNVMMALPEDFLSFVENAQKIVIEDKEQITAVTTDEEEKLKLREEIAAMSKRMEDAAEAIERMKELHEAAEATRQKEREQEARKVKEVMKRLNEARLRTFEANAIVECNRLKEAYGNGISFKFVITNKSEEHTLTKWSVDIYSGKDSTDPYVKFPNDVAPMTSAAGFHAKRNAVAGDTNGKMTYDINGAWFYVEWYNPWSGKYSASAWVESKDENKDLLVDAEYLIKDGIFHAKVKDKDAP